MKKGKNVNLHLSSIFQLPHQGFLPGHMHIINALLDANADEKLVISSIIWTLKFSTPQTLLFWKSVNDCEQVYKVGFQVYKPCGARLQAAHCIQ